MDRDGAVGVLMALRLQAVLMSDELLNLMSDGGGVGQKL